MNKVILKGRTTKDTDLRYTAGENAKAVARNSIAVERRYKKDERTADFFNLVAWGKTAEIMGEYVKKGTEILVEGYLDTNSYTNKEGQKVNTTDVVIERLEFCGKRSDASTSATEPAPEEVPEVDEALPFN